MKGDDHKQQEIRELPQEAFPPSKVGLLRDLCLSKCGSGLECRPRQYLGMIGRWQQAGLQRCHVSQFWFSYRLSPVRRSL